MNREEYIPLGNPPFGTGKPIDKRVKKLRNRLSNANFFAPFTLGLPVHILGLDAQYALHVFSDCAELLLKRPDWTIDKAFDQAMIWRPKLIEFILEVNNCPRVMKIFGTARDNVIGRNGGANHATIPEVKETIHELAKLAVAEQFSLVNGGADSGIMGEATDAWISAITEHKCREEVTVFLVPLRFKSPEYYGSSTATSRELIVKSPPQPAITLRATLLHALGINNALSIYTPGGFGTLSEFAQELEHDELAKLVHTAHSHRTTVAPYLAINPKIPGGKGRFFDGLIDHFNRCIEVQTLDRDQMPWVKLVSPDDPAQAAMEIFEHAKKLQEA